MKVLEKKHTYIADLHFDNKVWRNELNFYKDEVSIFENRLADLEKRNNKTDFLAEVESLQNRFIRQKEVIDILRHEINVEEDALAKFAQEHPIAVDRVYFDDHTQLREKVDRFKVLYDELKDEFNRFASKWM